jgi:zinc protease
MTMLAIPGLMAAREVLSNGVVVLVKSTHATPAVTISASFDAGSLHDPMSLPGRAHFLSRVLDRGTARRTGDELADDLDSRGVALAVGVTRHRATVSCSCLAEDFEAVLDLVADVVRRPIFPDEEVSKRRLEILTALRQDEDNPAVRASETLVALLYGADHPYGRPAKGTPESVARMERAHLLALHAERFVPGALTLAIVGDIQQDAALAAATRLFGDWQAASAPRVPVPPASRRAARRLVVLPMMNKMQADIAYGFVAVPRLDPDYYAVSVMNNVLGQYGLGGRLGERIRERQGMAYYAFSSFEGNVGPGPLVIRAGVGGADVERALDSIDREVARMAAEGITAQELEDSRRYLVGSIPRTLETNYGIAKFLQVVEQFGLGPEYERRLPDLYGRVTRDDVMAAARRILDPSRAVIAVAGPYDPAVRAAGEPLLASEVAS